MEAEKSLSGGNLSGSNGAIQAANAPIAQDEVLKQIYNEQVPAHKTAYKLDSADVAGSFEVLDFQKTISARETEPVDSVQMIEK